jgi:hypothetical protein
MDVAHVFGAMEVARGVARGAEGMECGTSLSRRAGTKYQKTLDGK